MFRQKDCLTVFLSFCSINDMEACKIIPSISKLLTDTTSKNLAIEAFKNEFQEPFSDQLDALKNCKNALGTNLCFFSAYCTLNLCVFTHGTLNLTKTNLIRCY